MNDWNQNTSFNIHFLTLKMRFAFNYLARFNLVQF